MSDDQDTELMLSQLTDGELSVDEANRVLLQILDDENARQQLRKMLALRRELATWRRQEPPRAVIALSPVGPTRSVIGSGWPWMVSLATAAVLGGVLVAGGLLLGRSRQTGPNAAIIPSEAISADQNAPTVIVTPQQQRDIAQVFALHESVSGPLSWYAADDANIQVAGASAEESAQTPIAILLRLHSTGESRQTTKKTYVIVCRNNDPAVIDLPAPSIVKNLRLRLLPEVVNGKINVRYALAADATDRGPQVNAALTGVRGVGLSQTPLGQLALNDCLIRVDAAAWVIHKELQ